MNDKVLKQGIRYGLIGGILFLVINYGAWASGNTNTFVTARTLNGFIPYIIVMLIIAGLALRKSNGNVLSFQQALKFAFLAYIIVALTEAIGNYILFNWIDHNLTAKVFEITKAKALKMMQALGSSDSNIEDRLNQKSADTNQTTLKNVVLGLGLDLVWYFCKALLIALVIRKEEKFTD